MEAHDIEGVIALAGAAFPDHPEEAACFEERLNLYPQGCFVLDAPDGLKGYLIAYPWQFGEVPPLNSLLGELPTRRDALYLHDLALHDEVRGLGLARPVIEQLARDARLHEISRIALVAVNGSVPFWNRMGFERVLDEPSIGEQLQSYNSKSAYLVRQL